ncbi:MAG: ion transporter [Pseudomonadales bacterium]|nr:ion transporter [Pseudomonadales bacterium]
MPWAKHIVASNWFNHSITGVIVLNAIVIGLDTSETLHNQFGWLFEIGNYLFLTIFIVEAAIKIIAESPKPLRYFKNSWNIFDFSIIVISLLPATGQLAMLARLARLLRVLRLISTLPELRLIVETLVRSIPSMANVIALMSIIFYIYAVAGFHLFNEIDPTHWRTLGISLLTLFRIVTLEDWTDIMYAAMEVGPLAWPYFVSFVILGTFVVVNLFIAVVINNLDEAKAERLADLTLPPTSDDILKELRETQAVLTRMRSKLERLDRE